MIPLTHSNDAAPNSSKKESPTLEDTVDAELWLNLMTSMMNFAVASTNLMKVIQDKTGVSVTYKDDMNRPQETVEVATPTEAVKEEICDTKTCDALYQADEATETSDLKETKDDGDAPPVTEILSEQNASKDPESEEVPNEEVAQSDVSQSEESPENEGSVKISQEIDEEQQEGISENNDVIGSLQDASEEKHEDGSETKEAIEDSQDDGEEKHEQSETEGAMEDSQEVAEEEQVGQSETEGAMEDSQEVSEEKHEGQSETEGAMEDSQEVAEEKHEGQSETEDAIEDSQEVGEEKYEGSSENKDVLEDSQEANEEQHEGPSENEDGEPPDDKDPTGNSQDVDEMQPSTVEERPKKSCNVVHQEKEPYKELCSGACGSFPPSRIPVPIKKKKHKYSLEIQKKIEAAQAELKSSIRPCGCTTQTEECNINPCSCDDLTLCAPSSVPGVCACSFKKQTAEEVPEEVSDSPSASIEEPMIERSVPELSTAPTFPDAVSTEEISVQATDAVSEMCCCDEQLLEEEYMGASDECECQTDPIESLQDLEMATISEHLQQTDANLQELRKEVQRISDCISGRKRYADDVAAALYREIMKPRTSIVEVTAAPYKMSPRRRADQSWF